MTWDAHHHVGGLHFGGGEDGTFAGSGRADPYDVAVDYETTAQVMDDNDIDKAVAMPTPTYDRRDGTDSTRALNDSVAEIAAEFDRFACGLGTVEPSHGDAALDELERIADLGLAGVAWHHRFSGVAIDEPVTRAAVDRLDDLDLVAFVHCYPESGLEDVGQMDAIAELTDQPIVVLDALYSPHNVPEVIELGRKHDNLYFDTAVMNSIGLIVERLVDQLGADRVVAGTDFYSDPVVYRRSSDLFQVRTADITEGEREQILEGNLRRILGR